MKSVIENMIVPNSVISPPISFAECAVMPVTWQEIALTGNAVLIGIMDLLRVARLVTVQLGALEVVMRSIVNTNS